MTYAYFLKNLVHFRTSAEGWSNRTPPKSRSLTSTPIGFVPPPPISSATRRCFNPRQPDWLRSSSFRQTSPIRHDKLSSWSAAPDYKGVNPKLGSFHHFRSPPQSGPVRAPVSARAHCAHTPLVVRQSFDSIGINSKLGSFRHLLATPTPGLRPLLPLQ